MAVENLVFKEAWHKKNPSPPRFHGRVYPLLEDNRATALDEAHGLEPHYEQHLWVFRDNPKGVYSAFNPDVTYRHHNPAPERTEPTSAPAA